MGMSSKIVWKFRGKKDPLQADCKGGLGYFFFVVRRLGFVAVGFWTL